MPAVLCSGEIETLVPPGLTSLDIKSLTSRTDLVNKYVQATVCHRYLHIKKPVSSLKCVLENNDGSTIELMAIGQVADDLDICVKGDVLIFLKFEVEACPGHCSKSYQMIVDDTGNIFKSTNKSKITSQARLQTASSLRSYSYKSIAELKVNTIVDVYGVVKFYKPPTKTRGTDFCCVIGLTDPSLDSLDDKLSCNIFSSTEAQLPKLELGYIVRFHRLKIKTFNGKKQGYNGPGFQWLIFRGSYDDREASSSSYTIEQHDEDRVKNLLQWWQEKGPLRITKKLSEVQPKEYFNLICQVIRVCDLEVSQCTVFRVWDGSKFQSLLKMTAEEGFNDSVQEDGTLIEASADMAVDVYLFDNHRLTTRKVKPGDFIQLTNLHAAVVSDRVELTLHGGTSFERGVEVLSGDLPQTRHLKALLTSIVEEIAACNLLMTKNSADESIHRKDTVSPKKVINTSGEEKNDEASTSKAVLSKVSSVDKCILLDNKNTEINHESGNLKTVKRQLMSVDNCERNNLTNIEEHNLISDFHKHLEAADNGSEKKRMKTSHIHTYQSVEDPLEETSDSGQSLWFSAYDDSDTELQVKRGLVSKGNHKRLQDNSISSSGTSVDSPYLPSAGAKHNETSSDTLSDEVPGELNKSQGQLSQDSFYTASSLESVDATELTAIQASTTETRPTQKPFLSLKSEPDTQEVTDDGHQPLPLCSNDILSLTYSILCIDTDQSTETDSAVNTPENVFVEETQVSQCAATMSPQITTTNSVLTSRTGDESEKQPRCMLKTATTVIGHHTLVPETSLKDVLSRGVCQKVKVLVKVQCMTPVTPGKLVNFICVQCGHTELAESVKVPLDTHLPEHVCPASFTQCEQLKPVIILTFVLTDGQDSLTAYVWEKNAIQFLCGIEPLQLLSDAECFNQVQERLQSLCPQGSRLDERPLLECCLFSYGTEASVKYQIFDTVLV